VVDIHRRRITWIAFPEYAPVPWGQEVLERYAVSVRQFTPGTPSDSTILA